MAVDFKAQNKQLRTRVRKLEAALRDAVTRCRSANELIRSECDGIFEEEEIEDQEDAIKSWEELLKEKL